MHIVKYTRIPLRGREPLLHNTAHGIRLDSKLLVAYVCRQDCTTALINPVMVGRDETLYEGLAQAKAGIDGGDLPMPANGIGSEENA